MSKHSLLLVDGDARSLRVLEVSLRKAGFTVTPAASVQDALDKLELHPPDLIISETTFPDGDGFELRRRVRAAPDWGEIPFVFLTAESAIEHKIRGLELGVDDYLTKPIYIKEIVTRIHILLQKRQRARFDERQDGRTRFAGRVEDMPVVDVIQTVEISRKSGVIQFVGERGHHAAIYFRDGKVIDAEAGSLQAEDAVYRLLTWNEGEFEVEFRTVRRREVIATSAQGLLMEGMRRLDEWSRLLEQLPALGHRFEVDAAELAIRLGDVPDDNNRILRLVDGKRSLLEVIDASDVGDLECLQAISRLYFEGMLVDLDHGAPADRATGALRPLVELDAPAEIVPPVESGPVAELAAETLVAGGVAEITAETETAIAARAETAVAAGAETGAAARPGAEAGSGTETGTEPGTESAAEAESAAETESEAETEAEIAAASAAALVAERQLGGPLLGGYRPSSLRLIDEAVAAAEAIEPSLFADHSPSTQAIVSAPIDDERSVPEEIDADEPPDDFEGRDANLTPPFNGVFPIMDAYGLAQPVRREDSGLRMIGSLGRDRASASGEVVPAREPDANTGTQRELITIMPRRATREIPVMALRPSEPEPAVEPPRFSEPPSARRSSGPGAGAITLLVLAGILAGMALYLRLRKHPAAADRVRTRDGGAAAMIEPAPPDAAIATSTSSDAMVVATSTSSDASVVATSTPSDAAAFAVVADAGTTAAALALDAGVATASADAGVALDAGSAAVAVDPRKQAAVLLDQAGAALARGDLDIALELTDNSLHLRRTVRGYLMRADVEQSYDHVDEALEAVDGALGIVAEYPPAWEQRGRILWKARRYDEARAAYEHFLEIAPNNRDAPSVRNLLAIPQ